jgi:glycosyltransferase involved in cell wall biosynthesis
MLKLLYRSFSSRIGCFLPVGRASSDVLIKILDIPSRKIEFLFLGADTTRFRKSVKLRNEGRAELHITDHDILIITSGKFHKNRDIDVLLNSFALISEKIPCLKLLLLGGGSKNYMDKLHSEVKDQHLIDRVIFHEFVSHNELPKFYNAADIGIWPGWPSITVNEAIACGLPVIVPRDFLQYHHLFENFVVLGFKRGDSQELAEKILCFIDNEDQRQMIIKNAESFFKTTISWEAIAKKSIQIYSKYLPEKRIQ